MPWVGRAPHGSWSPTPGSTQDHLKPKLNVWEYWPNAPWTQAALGCAHYPEEPVPCPPPSGKEPFSNIHSLGSHCFHQSRAQPSIPCEELQLPWGLPSAPMLWAEQTQGPQLLLIHFARSLCTHSPDTSHPLCWEHCLCPGTGLMLLTPKVHV